MDDAKSLSDIIPCSLVDESAIPHMPDIPRRRYTDESFFKSEIDGVFKRTWLLVGHESEYEKSGSFKVLQLDLAPIVVVRGKDGTLRAFLNSCRHRGSQLANRESGCTQVLTCPLHGWTYSLEGKLIGVKNQEKLPHLDATQYGLVSLRCEQWGGLVFINFDQNAPALLDWLTPSVTARYTSMFQSPLRVVWSRVWEVNCNWKAPVEGFREVYHFDMIHGASSAQMVNFLGTSFELYRNGHDLQNIPYLPQHRVSQADWEGTPVLSSLRRLPGIERPEFSDHLKELNLFPNISLGFFTVGIHIVAFWPVAVDKTRITTTWLGPDWGPGPQPEAWAAMISGFEQVMDEDWANLESIQRSYRADPDKRNPNASMEMCLYHLNAEIDNVIGREKIREDLQVPDVLSPFYI